MITLNSHSIACPVLYSVDMTGMYNQVVVGTALLKISTGKLFDTTFKAMFIVDGVTTYSPSFNLKTVCLPFPGMGSNLPSVYIAIRYSAGGSSKKIITVLGNASPDTTLPFPYVSSW
jgi:hypothetical protein